MEKLRHPGRQESLPGLKGQIAGYRGEPPARPGGSQALHTDHSQNPLRLWEYRCQDVDRETASPQEGPAKPLLQGLKSQGRPPTTGGVLTLIRGAGPGTVLRWAPVLKRPAMCLAFYPLFVLWKLILAVPAIWHQVIDGFRENPDGLLSSNPFSPSTMPLSVLRILPGVAAVQHLQAHPPRLSGPSVPGRQGHRLVVHLYKRCRRPRGSWGLRLS